MPYRARMLARAIPDLFSRSSCSSSRDRWLRRWNVHWFFFFAFLVSSPSVGAGESMCKQGARVPRLVPSNLFYFSLRISNWYPTTFMKIEHWTWSIENAEATWMETFFTIHTYIGFDHILSIFSSHFIRWTPHTCEIPRRSHFGATRFSTQIAKNGAGYMDASKWITARSGCTQRTRCEEESGPTF